MTKRNAPTAAKPRRYRYVRWRWRLLMTIIDTLGGWLIRLLGTQRAPRPWSSEPVDALLLIQLDHLGDALLTTSMLSALRQRWPLARIDVLAAPWNRAVFAAQCEVDHIEVCSTNRFVRNGSWFWPWSLLAWAWRLRRRRYDVAIDVRGELPHAVLMLLSGARRRVGCSSGGGGFLLTDDAPHDAAAHEIDKRRGLLTALGIELPEGCELRPQFAIEAEARQRVEQRWIDWRRDDAPLIVLHIGAGTAAKRWPVSHWRELLGRLIVELNSQVILVGHDGDVARAKQILDDRAWPNTLDWTGQLTLAELAATIEWADVFVGADSGPAHLAATLDRATVVLFSGTNSAEVWQPIGSRVVVMQHSVACAPCHRTHCPLAGHPCMSGVLPARVFDEVREMVARPTLPVVTREVRLFKPRRVP